MHAKIYTFTPWTEMKIRILDTDDYNNVQKTVLWLTVIESSVHCISLLLNETDLNLAVNKY